MQIRRLLGPVALFLTEELETLSGRTRRENIIIEIYFSKEEQDLCPTDTHTHTKL